ncbi:hypothetical protein THAOC_29806, partial [Thalassiosira oceanica]
DNADDNYDDEIEGETYEVEEIEDETYEVQDTISRPPEACIRYSS